MREARILVSWSTGKDSAWALHVLQEQGHRVVGLLTTVTEAFARVSMQGVRRSLLHRQALTLGLEAWEVSLPWPCPNQEYERRMARAVARAREAGITHVAFGDLHLEDVRAYRIAMLEGTGIEPLFPIWTGREGTKALAGEMLAAGLGAIITCVDLQRLDRSFAGRSFDEELLDDLPEGIDPLGENGEFHTFCHTAPIFHTRIDIRRGEIVERDGFAYADLLPG